MSRKRLTFVTGRAGSGKSTWVLHQIREAVQADPSGPPVWWVVPPHLTYETERRLLEVCEATMRVEILTFTRLAERLLPPALPLRPLTQTGARLLLARLLEQHASALTALYRPQPPVAYLDALLRVFREWSDAGVSPVQARGWREASAAIETLPIAPGVRPLWAAKVEDLALLYHGWYELQRNLGLYDPHDVESMAVALSHTWPNLQGTMLFIDGFSQLTAQTTRFVQALLQRGVDVVITFAIDPEQLRRVAAQAPNAGAGLPSPYELYLQWEKVAADEGIEPRRIRLTEPRRFIRPDLVRLEAQLADAGGRDLEIQEPPAIRLLTASDPRAEVEAAVQTVLTWVIKEGLHWNDVLLLVPDLATYGPLLRVALRAHEIPVAIDEYPSLALHPLGQYVLALLQCAAGGMTVENVTRLLKTELCPLARHDADWLELYLTQHEVPAEAWREVQPWTFAQDEATGIRPDLDVQADLRADALRRTVANALEPVWTVAAAGSLTPADFARALWEALVRAGAKNKVAQWIVNDQGLLSPAEASQHEQAWNLVLALLEDLASYPGTETVSRQFVFELVRRGLLDARLSTIPPQAGTIRVTDYARAAGLEARAVLVLGATDGALPPRVHPDSLFDDEERRYLRELTGLRIGRSLDERQLDAQTQPYVVLTRAREQLVIARPLSGTDGKGCREALAVTRLRALLGGRLLEGAWGDTGQPVDVWTEVHALRWLIDRLRDGRRTAATDPFVRAILGWFQQDRARGARLRGALRGLTHRAHAEPLPAPLARKLFGVPLHLHPYQVETYAACPYRHFLQYGLRLSVLRPAEPDAARRGALLHDALQAFVSHHAKDPHAWAQLSDEAAEASMRDILASILDSPRHAVWRRTAARRHALRALERTLGVAAVAMTRHARRGQYRPHALEWSFSVGADGVSAAVVGHVEDVPVHLRGRIDRLDVAETAEGRAYRIVDYKSGRQRLNMDEVAHGLGMQLLLYWLAVEQILPTGSLAGAEFAGVVVLPLHTGVESTTSPEPAQAAREKALRKMSARPWLVAEDHLIQAMDSALADGGSTELFPAIYKKDGTLRADAPVFSRQAWRVIRGHVRRQLLDIAHRMLGGDIAISPYRLGKVTACQYCPYASVCHVDPRWDPRPFRSLISLKPEAWLTQWEREQRCGEEEED